MRRVLGRFRRQVLDQGLVFIVVHQRIACAVQALKDNQRLHRTHFQSHERVLDAENIAPGVLGNLFEKLGDEPLFLNKLDIGENLGAQLDGLVESVLTAVADIDDVENDVLRIPSPSKSSFDRGQRERRTRKKNNENARPVPPPCTYVYRQSRVKDVGIRQLVLKVCRSSQNQPRNVRAVVRNELLH